MIQKALTLDKAVISQMSLDEVMTFLKAESQKIYTDDTYEALEDRRKALTYENHFVAHRRLITYIEEKYVIIGEPEKAREIMIEAFNDATRFHSDIENEDIGDKLKPDTIYFIEAINQPTEQEDYQDYDRLYFVDQDEDYDHLTPQTDKP